MHPAIQPDPNPSTELANGVQPVGLIDRKLMTGIDASGSLAERLRLHRRRRYSRIAWSVLTSASWAMLALSALAALAGLALPQTR